MTKHGEHPANFDDKTGRRYGRLVVVEYVYKGKWLCKCDCGNETVVPSVNLANGHTKSCGCLNRDVSIAINTKHGGKGTRLYAVWKSMKSRCYNKNERAYSLYGGRGILVCDEWLDDFATFRNWAMENGYDPNAPRGKCTIDRINVNGNYEPSNCRFVDMKTQARNRRPYKQNHYCHPVQMLDKDGNVIKSFDSIKDAARSTGIKSCSISDVCRGRRGHTHGTYWRYASDRVLVTT